MVEHLGNNNVDLDKTPLTLGVPLIVDAKRERFTGPDAARANKMLTREYRAPYTVPSIVLTHSASPDRARDIERPPRAWRRTRRLHARGASSPLVPRRSRQR